MENREIYVNAWTHPRTGQVRRYIDWQHHLLEVDSYKSGNIRDAAWLGESISNAQARRLMLCKAWLDGHNRVKVTYVDNNAVDEDGFKAAIADLVSRGTIVEKGHHRG